MNEVTTDLTSLTVRKVRNGAKVRVELLENGVVIDTAGGNRADRAKAVLVSREPRYGGRTGFYIYGLRADVRKAEAEAESLGRDTRHEVPCRAILDPNGRDVDPQGRSCTTSISSNAWTAAVIEGRTTTSTYPAGRSPFGASVLTITEEVYGV